MNHPDKIYNVSQSQLSIARHYGGITYNGVYYVYDPSDDTLTRASKFKNAGNWVSFDKEEEREKWRNANPGLDL